MTDPRFPSRPWQVISGLWHHRVLVWQLARRDVVGRYRGSYLGLLWSLFHPLLMLGVYTFVFGTIFRARWSASPEAGQAEFAVILFAGLTVFAIFSECVNRAPGLVLANTSFVKRVVFPLEILPWVALGSSLFHAAINLLVLLAATLAVYGKVPPTWPWIFVVVIPMIFTTLGICWALAALGVYLRDVAQTVSIVTAALMFLSPIFYPVTAVPETFRGAFTLNPLTFIIEQARAVCLWGRMPDPELLAIHTAVGLLVAWGGLALFQRMRPGFADVL